MSLFLTILRFEWQWLLRHRLLLPVIFLLLATGTCALYYGHTVVRERTMAQDSIRVSDAHRFDSLLYQLTAADTMTAEGKKVYKQLSHPSVVQFQLKPATLLPVAPLSMLSLGVSDVAGYYHRLEVSWSYLRAEEKINNPLHLLTGNLDLSFLLVYLFPLLLIGVSYNMLSREKEQGTFPLLFVQGIHMIRLLAARIIVRWLLFFILFMLLAAAAPVIQGTLTIDLLYWGMITAAYILFWCTLLFLIAAFNQSSAFNISVMTAVWIVLLILVPALFRLSAEDKKSTTQTATIAAEQREQEWSLWDMPKKALLDSFYGHYPHYRGRSAYDTSAGSSRRVMAYYDLVARRMDRFVAKDEALRKQEQDELIAGYYFNPAVYTQSLLNQVAHTDATDYSHYEAEIEHFHQQWKDYFLPFFFYERVFTPAAYTKIPVFHHIVVPAGHRAVRGICYLLLLSIVMGAAGAYLLNKNDHL